MTFHAKLWSKVGESCAQADSERHHIASTCCRQLYLTVFDFSTLKKLIGSTKNCFFDKTSRFKNSRKQSAFTCSLSTPPPPPLEVNQGSETVARLKSWSPSSSSPWAPSSSSWLWWGPSCARAVPHPTRKSKKEIKSNQTKWLKLTVITDSSSTSSSFTSSPAGSEPPPSRLTAPTSTRATPKT